VLFKAWSSETEKKWHKYQSGKLGVAGAHLAPGGRLGIILSINGSKEEALIDTGATLTLLRYDAWIDICRATGRAPLLRPAPHLVSVNGTELDVLGTANIKVADVPRQDMIVVKDISHRLILGDDFLKWGQAIISYGNEQLHWFGTLWKMHRYGGLKDRVQVTAVGPGPLSDYQLAVQRLQPDIDKIMGEYSDIFTQKGQPIGFCDVMPLEINTGGARPIRQRAYRAPLAKRQEIDKQIEQLQQEGLIAPSNSPWASPITFQVKSSGDLRFCIDYRKLNAVTRKDSYPCV
jgi:hypothetical protein